MFGPEQARTRRRALPAQGIVWLAAATAAGWSLTPGPPARAADEPSSADAFVRQMHEQMQQLEDRMRQAENRASHAEERATQAEARATQAESKVAAMQRSLATGGMPKSTQLIEQSRQQRAKAKAQEEGDLSAGTPEYRNYKEIPVVEEKPFATVDINYFYNRAAWATNLRGGERFLNQNDTRNTAFVNPLVSDNNAGRLGNELDTYFEDSFRVITAPLSGSPAEFGAQLTLDAYSPQRNQVDLPLNFRTLDFFAFARHVLPFSPDAEVWVGRRGYDYQFYMNIIDRRTLIIGGDGGGINNLALGDFAKLDFAYVAASPQSPQGPSFDPLQPLGGEYGQVRTQRGNLEKQTAWLRLHDVTTPLIGGKSSLIVGYSLMRGGHTLQNGDYQGQPGGFSYNNISFKGGLRFPYTDGYVAAYTHEINLPRLTAQLALKNKLLLGCGWGADYDTTYAGTFNLSPYYNVPAYTLQQFNHNRAYTLADAHNLKFSDQLNLSYKKIFELEAYVVYEHQNSGRPNVPVADPTLGTSAVPAPGYYAAGSAANGTPVYAHAVQAKGTQDWFDVGVRPAVNLTPYFALVSELTYNYVDNRAYDADRRAANQYLGTRFKTGPGHLVKFTLCPTLQYGTVGNYPVLLRFYYTVAWWNDALKGSTVGGDAYLRRNVGQIVGTQAEVNF